MGQKSHPIGLRLGIHRKWSTSWFSLASTGTAATVSSRGGIVRSGLEDRIYTLFSRLPLARRVNRNRTQTERPGSRGTGRSRRTSQRRVSNTPTCVPVDLQVRPSVGGTLAVVVSYAIARNR